MKVMEQGRMTREEIEQKTIMNSKGAAISGQSLFDSDYISDLISCNGA